MLLFENVIIQNAIVQFEKLLHKTNTSFDKRQKKPFILAIIEQCCYTDRNEQKKSSSGFDIFNWWPIEKYLGDKYGWVEHPGGQVINMLLTQRY